MTLLGKILTVVIFIMSICFMSLALAVYSTHKSWRDVVTRPAEEATPTNPKGLKFQYEDLKKENDALEDEIRRIKNELSAERAARSSALAVLNSQLLQKEKELDNLQQRNLELTESQQLAVSTMSMVQKSLEEMKGEVEGLRSEVNVVRDDQAEKFKTMVALADELGGTKGTLTRLQSRSSQLVDQLAKYKAVMTAKGINPDDPPEDVPPALGGFVLQVKEDLLEISLGSDDGLRVGHFLEVFRNRTYLGRAVIKHVEVDRAVAKMLPDFRKGPVQRGDRVQTKTSVSYILPSHHWSYAGPLPQARLISRAG